MDYFNRRLISIIRVTEEVSLRINVLEKKRKSEVATTAQVINKVNWSYEKAKNSVASIVEDKNPTAERKSIRFAQDQ